MPRKFIDMLRLAKPLDSKQKTALDFLSQYLDKDDIIDIKTLIKLKKASAIETKLNLSKLIGISKVFYNLHADIVNDKINLFVNEINMKITEKINEEVYKEFSETASVAIPSFIGMNIHGLDAVKKAVALQLFAIERVHILLLGDPGTGKTDILVSASNLHPISSFGLGSGTSGVGLSVTVKGNEINKGLLPNADQGISAIDELNLMDEKDRASLYNAMEKGFVSYDKGGKHIRFDARVRIIATSNPKGDRFGGWTAGTIRKQMPFDPALLSRFHLVFLIRRPNLEKFVEISKKILSSEYKKTIANDEEFIKGYVSFAEKLEVKEPSSELKRQIVDFIADIKHHEKNYLIEVSPRLVIGFVRLAKASARMRLATEITEADINLVKHIFSEGLKLDSS